MSSPMISIQYVYDEKSKVHLKIHSDRFLIFDDWFLVGHEPTVAQVLDAYEKGQLEIKREDPLPENVIPFKGKNV